MAPSHVLVPLDGSPLADEALVHALETFDCRTTVVNVVTPIDRRMSEGGIIGAGEERKATAEDHAEAIVDRASSRATAAGRAVETVVETGDPADTIVDLAIERDVDHVVMGGHSGQRNELARRLLGTVATSVVADAPVTVTVVR